MRNHNSALNRKKRFHLRFQKNLLKPPHIQAQR